MFSPTWCMCSQDNVPWGFSAEELAISPVKGPCDGPVAHHAEVKGQGLLSLGWGRLQGEITALHSAWGWQGQTPLRHRVLGQETSVNPFI